MYIIFFDLQTFASKNISLPKPPLHHFLMNYLVMGKPEVLPIFFFLSREKIFPVEGVNFLCLFYDCKVTTFHAKMQ